jgi:hypothetical protein
VADPAALSRLILALQIKDGFIAYLNGKEIGRWNAGSAGEAMAYTAIAPGREPAPVTAVLEVPPSRLESGRNVLAIQAIASGLDSDLWLLPVLAVVLPPDAERDSERTRSVLTGPDDAAKAALVAYREGRIDQRAGRIAEAQAHFERASQLDPVAAEPRLRRIACHRSLGELALAEALAREAIEKGEILEPARLWRAWHRLVLVDLARAPAEAIASWPRDPAGSSARPASDLRWILQQLADGGDIRIHCGGADAESVDGKRWSRDRFFLGGVPLERGAIRSHAAMPTGGAAPPAAPPGITERSFPGKATYRAGYSIPLPPGRYRVSLHFVEWTHEQPGRRRFDVLLEGRAVLEGLSPPKSVSTLPVAYHFEVAAADGALDLDFIAHRDHPRIAALEVEALD